VSSFLKAHQHNCTVPFKLLFRQCDSVLIQCSFDVLLRVIYIARGVVVREHGGVPFHQIVWSRNSALVNIAYNYCSIPANQLRPRPCLSKSGTISKLHYTRNFSNLFSGKLLKLLPSYVRF